jgi:hypothetical protein
VYIIKNSKRNAYKTYDGWTRITRKGDNATLDGLNDVMRFTEREAQLNGDKLPNGCEFIHFPSIRPLK